MRIISGNLKGRKINFIKNKTTRPLTDRVKENIFNLLNHSNNVGIKLENKNILDAYSGVGSFGLECISRGVKKVDFIEKDYVAYQILIKNIKDLCLEKNYDTENIDLENHELVMIEHHQSPNTYATIMFSHPEISSTCELIFNIAVNLGKKELINKEISTCLYLGMMTDTGSFQYNGVNGKTHNTLSFLLEKGITMKTRI